MHIVYGATRENHRMRALLTERELDTLKWVLAGKTDWEIATILDVSRKTVNFHIENAKRKLGQSSRITAIAVALRDGLLPYPPATLPGLSVDALSRP
jgi:LuxR family transcriptional regulator, transcriptional regulator of spore coat protein